MHSSVGWNGFACLVLSAVCSVKEREKCRFKTVADQSFHNELLETDSRVL